MRCCWDTRRLRHSGQWERSSRVRTRRRAVAGRQHGRQKVESGRVLDFKKPLFWCLHCHFQEHRPCLSILKQSECARVADRLPQTVNSISPPLQTPEYHTPLAKSPGRPTFLSINRWLQRASHSHRSPSISRHGSRNRIFERRLGMR